MPVDSTDDTTSTGGHRRLRAVLRWLPAAILITIALAASAVVVDDDGIPAAPAGGGAEASPTPILSLRRDLEPLQAAAADRALQAGLDRFVAGQPADTCLDVRLDGFHYAHRADDPQTPASIEKLLTAVAALTELGSRRDLPDRRPGRAGDRRGRDRQPLPSGWGRPHSGHGALRGEGAQPTADLQRLRPAGRRRGGQRRDDDHRLRRRRRHPLRRRPLQPDLADRASSPRGRSARCRRCRSTTASRSRATSRGCSDPRRTQPPTPPRSSTPPCGSGASRSEDLPCRARRRATPPPSPATSRRPCARS